MLQESIILTLLHELKLFLIKMMDTRNNLRRLGIDLIDLLDFHNILSPNPERIKRPQNMHIGRCEDTPNLPKLFT